VIRRLGFSLPQQSQSVQDRTCAVSLGALLQHAYQISLCHVRQSLPAYPHTLFLDSSMLAFLAINYFPTVAFVTPSLIVLYRLNFGFHNRSAVKLHQISHVSVPNSAGFLISQLYKPGLLISWEPYHETYPVVNTFSISSFRVEPLEPSVVIFCRTALKQFASKTWLLHSLSSVIYFVLIVGSLRGDGSVKKGPAGPTTGEGDGTSWGYDTSWEDRISIGSREGHSGNTITINDFTSNSKRRTR
jgi:hypothetical protein